MTVVCGKYEWDDEKNTANIESHGIDFATASDAFDDPFYLEKYDEAHSTADESRFVGFGMVKNLLVLTLASTERNGRTRIISARRASKKEEEAYYENRKNFYCCR